MADESYEGSDRHRARLGDYDLCAALEYNGNAHRLADIEKIERTLVGENDERDWHWLVKTRAGYAYVEGGCDCTGWDCQSHATIFDADTLDAALAEVPEVERRIFAEMIATGETSRPSPGRW